jgi:hypothetical protein
MTRRSIPRIASLAAALLLVSALAAGGAAVGVGAAGAGGDALARAGGDALAQAGGDDRGTDASGDAPDDAVTPPTGCFAGEGYPISIGETGATIDAIVHLSVLTDPAAGNEFGLEAAGTLDGDPVVTLGAGVRLTAREALANGVDPFAAFDVLYAYELSLPMFGGAIDDSDYRDDGAPIESGADVVAC